MVLILWSQKAEGMNDTVKLLEKNIDKINKFKSGHKTTKLKGAVWVPESFHPTP